MELKINKNNKYETIKELLYNMLYLSRSEITALKNNPHGILLNGNHATVRAQLHDGDIIQLALEDEIINENIAPAKLDFNIIYEDENIIAVDKPCGMPTHPSHNHYDDTLANALCYYYQQKNYPFVFRSVNRLDRETSGVVLVAKNRHTAHLLSLGMQKGEFIKTYYAVLCAEITGNGIIETYIRRAEESIIFRRAYPTGKESEYAYTEYETIKTSSGKTLIRAKPKTGRTHQLRVSFAHIGAPIAGDGLYGDELSASRLMLHAAHLSIIHPISKERITFSAELPSEFNI